jgi:hypothetical protein
MVSTLSSVAPKKLLVSGPLSNFDLDAEGYRNGRAKESRAGFSGSNERTKELPESISSLLAEL